MRTVLNGPYAYTIRVDRPKYSIETAKGKTFTRPATEKGLPKLYTFSSSGELLYVGITSQSMSSRIRFGINADGKRGYHGYKLNAGSYELGVWTANRDTLSKEMEGIEAEVAFLWRQSKGNWPTAQNEIHFWQTEQWQREEAQRVFDAVTKNADDTKRQSRSLRDTG